MADCNDKKLSQLPAVSDVSSGGYIYTIDDVAPAGVPAVPGALYSKKMTAAQLADFIVALHTAEADPHPQYAQVAATMLPAGGTTGQVLVKNSNSDFDAVWVDVSDGSGREFTPQTHVITNTQLSQKYIDLAIPVDVTSAIVTVAGVVVLPGPYTLTSTRLSWAAQSEFESRLALGDAVVVMALPTV